MADQIARIKARIDTMGGLRVELEGLVKSALHMQDLDTSLDMAQESAASIDADYRILLAEIERLSATARMLGGYAAFLNSCALSGELPETFEWYVAKSQEWNAQHTPAASE